MAAKNTRRTISFNRDLFELIHTAAAKHNQSAAQYASETIRYRLHKEGFELPEQTFDGVPSPEARTRWSKARSRGVPDARWLFQRRGSK